MKRTNLFIWIAFLIPMVSSGQYAYIPEFIGSGNLKHTDLTNPANYTVVGPSVGSLGAMDFGSDNVLYGISGSNNGLYSIDTTNGNTTLIATVTPPGSAFWTGMAMDPTDGTMYVCSTDGNTNTFYTINLSNGNLTLVGTNTYDDGVVGIAFDDGGQMYAIYLVRKFYSINKVDATGTLIGSMATSPTAGQWHGLDFCSQNQTMYMTAYNAFTFDNELYTINLATAAQTLVGSVGLWAGSIGCVPISITANFTADNTNVCESDVVNFSDLSSGGAVTWAWTFEGGTPGSSSAQNPSVTYNTAGTYDVQLIVSDGSASDTLLQEDFIIVTAIPGQAATPSGPTETCEGESYSYTTSVVAGAAAYEWMVDPASAGTMTGTGTTGTFNAASNWTGAYTVKVRATNDCGDGGWSPTLAANLNHTPEQYNLTGGGPYCEGSGGLELLLDGSETGVDYELFHDNISTGIIVNGTGNPISFGYQTEQGFYTVEGHTVSCSQTMIGENYIFTQPVPGQPGTPAGDETVCNDETSTYTSAGGTNTDTYTWTLSPAEAGTMTPNELTVEIEWSMSFSGTASLSLYGTNDCGDGQASEALEITVNMLPAPAVSGPSPACSGYTEDYATEDHAGSTYTWEVTGGSVVSGSGTNQVSVLWGDPGMGSVLVTEVSSEGCEATSENLEVTIEECISIAENPYGSLRIHPNPVHETLFIDLSSNDEVEKIVTIHTISGKILFKNTIQRGSDQTNYSIDVSHLPPGLYLLKVKTAEGSLITGKFIKN